MPAAAPSRTGSDYLFRSGGEEPIVVPAGQDMPEPPGARALRY